jgi:transposase
MEVPEGYILIKKTEYENLLRHISELMLRCEALENQNQKLIKRIEELESEKNKNSRNSSKPPSSDGLKKVIKNNREKSNRKQGGQDGHKGSGLSAMDKADEIVKCRIKRTKCECGKDLQSIKVLREEKHQVIDIAEVLIKVIDYLVEVKKCSCGKEHKGVCEFNGNVQYGKKLKALLSYLNVYQMLPAQRIQELFKDIFGLSIGDGTIQSGIKTCYENLENTQEEIKQSLISSALIHSDETGIRCQSSTQWIHSASNDQFTFYQMHRKRGNEGIDAMGILANYNGVCVHDRWASYDKYNNCIHALCNAHLLRDLRFIYEEEGRKWAGKLISILQQANKRKQEEQLTNHFRTRIRNQIKSLVIKALRNEPKEKNLKIKRGRKPKSKPIRLLEVFKSRLDDILLFLYRDDVPFDNNLAERDLRMIKLKQKISGCFRTKTGADIFCRIRSYISTSRKQGYNVWDAMTNAMSGNPIKFTLDY